MQRLFITRGLALAMLVTAGQPVWAIRDCDVPTESWQPRSAVNALAERNGWQVERLKIDDGCYEVMGRDAEGRRFKAKVDPATLQVLHMKREHGDREQQRKRQRGPVPPASAPSSPPPTFPQGASK